MSATLFNLSLNEIVANPDLRISRSDEGKVTATRTFTIRKADKDTATIQLKFSRGATLTSLSPDLGAFWNFLQLKSHDMQDEPGGICRVFATFDGYTTEGEFDFDAEKTYLLRGVLTERPIIEHPNYLSEVRGGGFTNEHRAIVTLYNGVSYVANDPTSDNPSVRMINSDEEIIFQMTEPVAVKWYKKIFFDGVRTYLAPQYEWTVEEANQGGLTSSQLTNFGKKETPPGSPPEPSGVSGWWHFVDLSDVRSSNSSSNSRTWRFNEGDVDADLYDY